MRKGTITEGGKKIAWNETASGISYSDGKKALPSVGNMDAKLAYKTANSPVEPPKPIEPPIVIVKPSPGTAREISNKELAVLRDVENENFVTKEGIFKDRCDFENLHNVSIDLRNRVQFETGQRAIQFNGNNFSGVTLANFSCKDIKDYVIDFWGLGNLKYTGQKGSFIDGITINNVLAENCGMIFHADGGVGLGLIKNLVLDGLRFINSPEPRSVVHLGNGMDYDIKNCIVDHVNYKSSIPDAPQGAHNGIFQLGGNGKFHDNIITNHQGNAVRSWLFSQDDIKTVEIFNNIVWNSSTYSAFEIQAKFKDEKGFKPANSKVYNNTAGKLNTWVMPSGKHYFEGQMLDLYETKGEFEYYNNLGFDMNRQSGKITNMINFNGGGTVNKISETNRYFDKWEQAVGNLTTFKSLHSGIGAQ